MPFLPTPPPATADAPSLRRGPWRERRGRLEGPAPQVPRARRLSAHGVRLSDPGRAQDLRPHPAEIRPEPGGAVRAPAAGGGWTQIVLQGEHRTRRARQAALPDWSER